MTVDIDCVVVGAGVIGLAVARELSISGLEVLIIERNVSFGMETSSRNSEVIHAGIHYPKGSLKAFHCVRGKQLLYDLCKKKLIPHKRIGKIIVANNEAEITELRSYYKNAIQNEVEDLTWIDKNQLEKLEPELNGVMALLSPSTGIIDSHDLMQKLLFDVEKMQGILVTNTSVISGKSENGHIRLFTTHNSADGEYNQLQKKESDIKSRWVVNCAGLYATELAHKIEGINTKSIPKTSFAKGQYYKLSGRSPFSRLIYPAKESGSLGIHVTIDMSGSTRFGPDLQWIDKINYKFNNQRKPFFFKAIKRYYPNLNLDDLIPDYCGLRPKIGGKANPSIDFKVQTMREHSVPGLINLFGFESPGLTSALSIARQVSEIIRKC